MKSQKITNFEKTPEKRWYDDACGTALALELVGERWSLLIVRELMFGGRRFSELRSGLPGISANILTQRLEGLERVGIVQRRKLPPPASIQIYELTPWGYEAEIILQELGRWATRSPLHDPTLPLSAASVMMSFRTMYSAARAGGEAATIGFRFGDDVFVVDFGPDGIHTRRAEPEKCRLVVSANPMSLASVVYGGRPVLDAEASGELTLAGDSALFDRFVGWFPLPEKLA
ncbi:MAG TPA: winged helix-turn-helix transcriptional regulator [Stellaceae bacterium]|jgi:DNA-binding HxlR family transcriptional regulator|nr:winged helix-turn-helix transcriptional regulator [Stellaceae bacterium]